MVPPAPSLFSITTVWPSAFVIEAPRVRATTSVGPPAAKGTTRVTVREGKPCAATPALQSAAASAHPNHAVPVLLLMACLLLGLE